MGIAVEMLIDCFNDQADQLVLISADSDQVPTVKAIKSQFPKKTVKVYFPPERSSLELLHVAKPIIHLGENEGKFRTAVMPATVSSEGSTKLYTRPAEWKYSG